jgi:hypothetical protein
MPDIAPKPVRAAVRSSSPAQAQVAVTRTTSTPPRPGLRPGTRNNSARKLVAISPTNSSSPPASPPALVIDGPGGPRDALNEIASTSGRSLTVPAKKRRRSSTTSSMASAAAKAVRERSLSAGSWYSYTSEPSADEVKAGFEDAGEGGKTILDPAFHFPAVSQAGLLGVPAEGQSMAMLRRKRSWSGSRLPYVGYGLP